MASQYDALIQNLGMEGLSGALELIAELSQWGNVTTLAAGDVQADLRKSLKLPPNRSQLLIACFAEAHVIDYDEANRTLILTGAIPWSADASARQAALTHRLQQARMLEASEETSNQDDPAWAASYLDATQEHQSTADPTLEPTQKHRPLSESLPEQQGQQPSIESASAPATDQVSHVQEVDQPLPSDNLSSTQKRVDEFAAALDMSGQSAPETDDPSNPPEHQRSPASAGFGRRAGRASTVVRPSGNAPSAEDMLKAAGIVDGNIPPPSPPADAILDQSTAAEPPSPEIPQPTPSDAPQTARPRWGKQPQPQVRPPAAPPVTQRGTTLRPGASSTPTPPVGNRSPGRRPGAEVPSTRATPAWESRRGGVPYGQNPKPKTEGLSEELKLLLLSQQAKTSLTLDIKTLRALAREINQYLSRLEQANLADDVNLRVELQTLLDQIERQSNQENNAEDA